MTENSQKPENMDDGSRNIPGTPSPNLKGDAQGGPSFKDMYFGKGKNGYPGGKRGSGQYQRLINWIPPHEVYIEPFLGGGGIMINKRPAGWNVGSDIDYEVIKKWNQDPLHLEKGDCSQVYYKSINLHFYLVYNDAIKVITKVELSEKQPEKVFIFCDPPYLMEARHSPGRIYRFEYAAEQHKELLKLLVSLKCMVMITGYRNPIYDDALSSWRRKDYKANTRGGLKPESCWMNYPEPTELHDYQYLGDTFKEREKIRLKQDRWLNRLNNLPVLERRAMMERLNSSQVS